ncbi:Sad1 / UNC-like protein [Teladorsagia circumcincta]|uniref:Sad1 / UNC-like protein n=1 Tax=Teladorsagia circumcincta TaxID=45464 RepID=A0A2G9UZ78_TELCI|nr:Sad1 / UNC-like protein [Teladorsagia circumcincta]
MPSEAFCFEGEEGKLTIHLWSNASVDAIEYEHDYWHDIVPISAPDRYDVLACMDRECENMVLLAECRYPINEKGGPNQICEIQNRSPPTDQVQVVFRTNHGQGYTCVYQLRVLNWN